MIYIGILDTAGICPSDSRVISKIPEDARGRVEKTKDGKERALRAGAYLVLSELARRCYDLKNLHFFYTDGGKPYINPPENVNNCGHLPYNMNISHDGDISAIVLTDEDLDVGIDVQTVKEKANAEVVSKRFFEKCSALRGESAPVLKNLAEFPKLMNKSVNILCFKYGEGEILDVPYDVFLSEKGLISAEELCFLKKWTYLESHLKMSGEGFGGLSFFDKIADGSDCCSLNFFNKEKFYFICVCAKEKTNLTKNDVKSV